MASVCSSPAVRTSALWPSCLLGSLALVFSADARAANWFAEAGVRAEGTYTDNSTFDTTRGREEDLILVLTPSLALRGEGRRARVAGSVALSAVTYANGSQDSALVPSGRISANVEAIERWFFLDAEVAATRSLDNPLAPRPDGIATFNRQNTNTLRLSPYLARALPDDIDLRVQSDHTWVETRNGAAGRASSYVTRHSFNLGRQPQPFGWSIEAARTDQEVEGSGADIVPAVDIARVRLRYAFDQQLAIGLRGGVERSQLFQQDQTASFAGAELTWRPTGRTRIEGFWESRTFGDAWQAVFTHRAPRVAWDLRGARELTSFAQSFIEIPATGDLSALLDAVLRSRVPDPAQRARSVEEFINQRGLPRNLLAPVNVFSDQVLVRTSANGTVSLLGQRSTLAITAFRQRDASPGGSVFALLTAPVAQVDQRGASIALNHRLSGRSAINAVSSYSETRQDFGSSVAPPVAVNAAGESRQASLRIQGSYQFVPRTTGFLGGRHQRFSSDVVVDSRENAVFAGLAHRF